jgi:predicted ArsR family transcriptional regulator
LSPPLSSDDRPTRERLLDLLRRGPRTVDELAAAVELTPNAVRQHLAHLERDHEIVRRGARHLGGAGKPAVLYETAPEREAEFSRAYAPVLRALLEVLPAHASEDLVDELLRDAAGRLSAGLPTARGDFTQRVRTAAEVLHGLGAATEVTMEPSRAQIAGYSCPLAEAVAVRPELCRVLERVLVSVTGLRVRECCERNGRPRCRFELKSSR